MTSETPRNTCETRVGRLLEIRVDAGYNTVADVDQMIAAIGATMPKIPADKRAVIAADWRGCRLMSEAAAERALVMLTGTNQRIERSVILTSESSPVALLQFMRLVRESKHPNRRIVSNPGEMTSWLDEVLDTQERARLRAFLRV